MSERTDLTGRLDRLAGEWAGGVTPAAPERVRARGRHRRQRRIAAGAVLACAALVAVLVPALRGDLLGGGAVAPAGPPVTTAPAFTAPAAEQGEVRVRLSDPPAGMPADLRVTQVECTTVPGEGLAVTGTYRIGGRSGGVELHPGDEPVEVAGFPLPAGALQLPARTGQLDGDVIAIAGDGVTADLADPTGRRGAMSGRFSLVDKATLTLRPPGTERLAFSWWCPPAP
jgi:hypothetical protein